MIILFSPCFLNFYVKLIAVDLIILVTPPDRRQHGYTTHQAHIEKADVAYKFADSANLAYERRGFRRNVLNCKLYAAGKLEKHIIYHGLVFVAQEGSISTKAYFGGARGHMKGGFQLRDFEKAAKRPGCDFHKYIYL